MNCDETDPRLRLPEDASSEVHPFTGATYAPTAAHQVRVTRNGQAGIFSWDGKWVAGEIKHADIHLCLWVSGGVRGQRSYLAW
jgi:hypothetical protein